MWPAPLVAWLPRRARLAMCCDCLIDGVNGRGWRVWPVVMRAVRLVSRGPCVSQRCNNINPIECGSTSQRASRWRRGAGALRHRRHGTYCADAAAAPRNLPTGTLNERTLNFIACSYLVWWEKEV